MIAASLPDKIYIREGLSEDIGPKVTEIKRNRPT
jgi:hypothetical protein